MPVKIFFCYAREDELLLNKLKAHLRPLQRQGLIEVWYDRDISAGTEWEQEIELHMNTAEIILLLVSPDFMDSDYCYSIEMKQALERHASGTTKVIPIILRPVYWHGELLGKLQALPTDGKPVTDPDWHHLDQAFYNITNGIYQAVEQLIATHPIVSPTNVSNRQPEMARLESATPTFSQLCILKGHTGHVTSVAISPNGEILASGSDDKTIRIWNLSTGQTIHTLTGHTLPVRSVAISPNGEMLVSGSNDEKTKVWNLLTSQEIRTLTPHKGFTQWLVETSWIYSVAISPNGETLVGGSYGKTIKIWNLSTGQEMRTLTGHTGTVTSVAISPNGKTLVSGSNDKTIKVWGI